MDFVHKCIVKKNRHRMDLSVPNYDVTSARHGITITRSTFGFDVRLNNLARIYL